MLDAPADRLDRGRDHIAPVGDRRGPEHDQQLGPLVQHLLDRLGERTPLMGDPTLRDDERAGGSKPFPGHMQGLLDDLRGEPRQQRGDDPDFADAVGRNPDERTKSLGDTEGGVALPTGHRERNDLDGRDHLARDNRFERSQCRERDRLMDTIETIDRGLVDHQHAGRLREQIGPPGESTINSHPITGHGHRDLGGSRVFRYVVLLDTRYHDLVNAGSLERGDLALPDQRTFLQNHAMLAYRMHRDATLGLADRHRAEFHDAFSSIFSAAGCLRRAVISPMMATAISGGDTAPMARPIGA